VADAESPVDLGVDTIVVTVGPPVLLLAEAVSEGSGLEEEVEPRRGIEPLAC
jgi:hypothetical protein